MDFVFKNPSTRVPTIEQLVMTEFFRNIDLREMRATSWPVSYYFILNTINIKYLNLNIIL